MNIIVTPSPHQVNSGTALTICFVNSRIIYQVITRHWLQLWYENGGWQEEIKWNIIVAPSPHLVSSGTALTICFVNSRTIYQVITRHWLQLWYENGWWQEEIKWNIIVAPSPHLVNSGTALTICFVNSRTIYQVITRHWLQLWYENGGWQEEIKWNIIVAPSPHLVSSGTALTICFVNSRTIYQVITRHWLQLWYENGGWQEEIKWNIIVAPSPHLINSGTALTICFVNSRTIYQVITRHRLQLWYENGGWQEEIKWNIIVAPSPHLVSSGTALTICFVNSRTIYQVMTRHWLQLWYENGGWQEEIKWNIIVAPSPHLVNSGTALTICFVNSRTIYQVITRHWLQFWYENGGWQEEIKWNVFVAPSPHLVNSGTALTICFVNSRTIYQVITRHWLQLWYENGGWQEEIKWNIIVAPSPPSGQFWNCPNHLFCEFQDDLSGDYKTLALALIREEGAGKKKK